MHLWSRARPVPDRVGFTLIELLVALVISGIVAGVVFDLLLGQGRFARYQNAREEVQQNARSALELISSELRAVGNDGIVEATQNSIGFWVPRAYGIVCGYPGGPNLVAVLYPAEALNVLWDGGGTAPDTLAVPPVGLSTDWNFDAGGDQGAGNIGNAVAECNNLSPAPPVANTGNLSQSRVRLYSYVPAPDSVPVGERVYTRDWVRFAVGPSTNGIPGAWIQRNSGSTMQPMAGPVPGAGGLVFTYYNAAGSDITATLLADSAYVDSIRRVDITVVTQSRARFNGNSQRDSATTTVFLRNRN